MQNAKEFGYARVSTTSQKEDRQVQALLDYGIEERNIVVDKESGKDFNRLGYLALKEKWLRQGDTLVVKELDRLGRNKAKIREELEWFKAEGIRLKVIDLPTTMMELPEGQQWVFEMVNNILIEVLGTIAEQERASIKRRQEEGIAIAKKKGVVFGRPVVAKPENFEQIMSLVDSGQMKAVEAMRELDVKKTTFYKWRQAYLSGR